MKTLPTPLSNHYNTMSTTVATALKITRIDGNVFAFTSHDVSDTIDGVVYDAKQGLDPSNIATTAGFNVGNLEIRTMHDGSLFTVRDILGNVWSNAKFELFRYNWASISDGKEFILTGIFGEIKISRNFLAIELRDLRQYFQQALLGSSSKTCRDRLGGPHCQVNLVPFTVTGAITSVTSARIFRDSARTEVADYFGEGIFKFTSGLNQNLSAKIYGYAADGTFTLSLPFTNSPSIGDTYIAIAGCRKRLEEDCRDKFDNVLRFFGEPHRVGMNNLTKSVTGV